MNKLRLTYEALHYPYPNEIIREETRWGWITLSVVDEADTFIRQLFRWQWDVVVLLDWLIFSEVAVMTEDLPKELHHETGWSIAQTLYEFYQSDVEYEDNLYDKIYEYRNTHGLRFGMRGTDILDVYMGKNDSFVEISYYSNDDSWQYIINATDFFEQVRYMKINLLL